jgi:hypothetical protein
MIRNPNLVSSAVETFTRKLAAGTLALAIVLPIGALAMDSTPKETSAQVGYALPLPSSRYLDTMRWMDWKPSVPVFKVDTLLVPDSTRPGVFRLPSDCAPNLPRVS